MKHRIMRMLGIKDSTDIVIGIIVALMYIGMMYWMSNNWLGPCIDGPRSQWEQRMAAAANSERR